MAAKVVFLRFKCGKKLLILFYSQIRVNLVFIVFFICFIFILGIRKMDAQNGCPKSGTKIKCRLIGLAALRVLVALPALID